MKTTDLCDKYSDQLAICRLQLKSYGKVKQFNGPIKTVEVLEDNVLVKEALQTIPEGSVLVVDGGASNKCALLGDNLAEIAIKNGVKGIIINGYVRDAADLAQLDVGVLALGTIPIKSVKGGKGQRDSTVNFGGVRWTPDHYVYVDEDGIVLSKEPLSL